MKKSFSFGKTINFLKINDNYRRRTILTISKVRNEDSGKYECQARSVFGGTAAILTTLVTVQSETRPENSEYICFSKVSKCQKLLIKLFSFVGSPCPIPDNSYCLNGGTCLYFETVGEPACKYFYFPRTKSGFCLTIRTLYIILIKFNALLENNFLTIKVIALICFLSLSKVRCI